MLRLRSENRFALLTPPLSMTLAICHPCIVSASVILSEAARPLRGAVEGSLPAARNAAGSLDSVLNRVCDAAGNLRHFFPIVTSALVFHSPTPKR